VASALLWTLIYTINKDAVNTYVLVQQLGFLYSGPLSIGALLAGVYGAHRDQGLKVDRLLGSLPYRSGRMLVTRLVILSLPFVFANLASVATLLYQWFFLLHREPDIAYPLMVLTVLALGIMYAVVLGWAIGVFFRGRVSYFIGFLLWFVHVYGGFLVLNSILPQSIFALPNFLLMDYESMGFMDEVWGFLRDSSIWLHRAFYLALTGLLLGCILGVVKSRRKEKVGRVWVNGLIVICLLATLSTAISYGIVRGKHIEAYQDWEDEVESQLAQTTSDPAAFSITDYDLTVRYKEQDASLEVIALLDIQSEQSSKAVDRLEMTLNPAFEVDKVLVNGTQAQLKREGYGLSIHLAEPLGQNERVKVQLAYTGKMNDWRLIRPFGQSAPKLVPAYATSSSQVYLPGSAGWYPIPGKHNLVVVNKDKVYLNKNSKWQDTYPAVKPSNYILSTDFPDSLDLFSNLNRTTITQAGEGRQQVKFVGKGMDGLALLAGPLKEIRPSDSYKVKGLVSQWMNDSHTAAFVTMADSNFRHILELLGIDASPITLLPFEPSNDKGSRNLGGVIIVDANTLNTPEIDTVASERINQLFVEYLTKAGYQESNWLAAALSAYIASDRKGKPVHISANGGPMGKTLENYMNEHTKAEVEQMLRTMYKMLLDNPDQPLQLNTILR
jgi:hypothetical protein